MNTFVQIISWINKYDGLWGFLGLILAIIASLVGLRFLMFAKKHIKGLNVGFSFRVQPRAEYVKRLYINISNQTGNFVLISHPYVRTRNRQIVSERADGHTSTNSYEIKFRGDGSQYYEHGFTLVPSMSKVETYLPLSDDADFKRLNKAFRKTFSRNYFVCDVLILDAQHRKFRYKVKIHSIQNRSKELDRDDLPNDYVLDNDASCEVITTIEDVQRKF